MGFALSRRKLFFRLARFSRCLKGKVHPRDGEEEGRARIFFSPALRSCCASFEFDALLLRIFSFRCFAHF